MKKTQLVSLNYISLSLSIYLTLFLSLFHFRRRDPAAAASLQHVFVFEIQKYQDEYGIKGGM